MYELYTLYCGTKMWKHDAKNVDKQKVLGCKSVFKASIQVDVLKDQPIKLILVVSTSEFFEKDLVFVKIIPLPFCRTSVACKIDWLKNKVLNFWTKTRIPRWKMGIFVPYYFKNFNFLTTINTTLKLHDPNKINFQILFHTIFSHVLIITKKLKTFFKNQKHFILLLLRQCRNARRRNRQKQYPSINTYEIQK